MTIDELKQLTKGVVAEARQLNSAHTYEKEAPVNYACIFAQSAAEYMELINAARQMGPVADDTATGPVFHIARLSTAAGVLRLLKIRRPDPKRPERGDADFTVADYAAFKREYLGRPGFGLIERPHMEMLELIDPSFNVLAYYSNPTLATVLKLGAEEPASSE